MQRAQGFGVGGLFGKSVFALDIKCMMDSGHQGDSIYIMMMSL